MIRLNAMDQAFLMLETEHRPMNIGALMELAPPAGFSGDLARHIVDAMLQRPVGPPFNHRLLQGPGPLGLGFTADDDIDATAQIHFHTLPGPRDRRAWFDAVCEIHEQRLDRSEPLWQLHVFRGLPGGRVGLYFKTHHVLVDGIGFLHIFERIVSATANHRETHAIWEGYGRDHSPEKAPVPQDLAARLLGAAVGTTGNLLGAGAMAARMLMRGAGGGSGLSLPFINTPSALKAPPSPHRVLGHCALNLTRVKRVAKRGGGTVNDVLLTVLDIAISRYSCEHDDVPDRPLIVDMPVALSKEAGTGNRVAILQLPLGRPGGTAAQRFGDIRAETRRLKEEVRSVPGSVLELYTVATHSAASVIEMLRLSAVPMLANAVVSNPYGMTRKVYYNRCPVEMALPMSVVAHHQSVNITATTYIDELNITFLAMREALPDIQRVAEYTVDALARLEAELGEPLMPESASSAGTEAAVSKPRSRTSATARSRPKSKSLLKTERTARKGKKGRKTRSKT
jgi:diacylglycerol O-acyltransferase / wax synthase